MAAEKNSSGPNSPRPTTREQVYEGLRNANFGSRRQPNLTSQQKSTLRPVLNQERQPLREASPLKVSEEKITEDTSKTLSPEEASLLQLLTPEEKEKLNKETPKANNTLGGGKQGKRGIFDTHDADKADEEDTKFEIKEGDIIDWMMKEVIIASANYVGGKTCKLAGSLLLGTLSGTGKLAQSGYSYLNDKISEWSKKKTYPTDTTGKNCRNANDLAEKRTDAARRAINAASPWRSDVFNGWSQAANQNSFTEELNKGNLAGIASRPLVKEKDDIDITSQRDTGQKLAITQAFQKEMIEIMRAVPEHIDGIDDAKLQAIKHQQQAGHVGITEINALTADERKRYDEACKKALENKLSGRTIEDYAAEKLKELSKGQEEYNKRKDEKYHEVLANGDTAALQNAFGMSNNNVTQLQNGESEFLRQNPGHDRAEYWQRTAEASQTQKNLLEQQEMFINRYAQIVSRQKCMENSGYTPSNDDFNKFAKEGRKIFKLAMAGGGMAAVQDLYNNLDSAYKKQEDDLKKGKYYEKGEIYNEDGNKGLKNIYHYRNAINEYERNSSPMVERTLKEEMEWRQRNPGTPMPEESHYRDAYDKYISRKTKLRVKGTKVGPNISNLTNGKER